MIPLCLSHFTATTCLGHGIASLRDALRANRSGLKHCDFETVDVDTWIGEVTGVDDTPLNTIFACRNNRLAELALTADDMDRHIAEAVLRYGADRFGVILATSTSGLLQTELAYRRCDPITGALPSDFNYFGSLNCYSLAAYVRQRFAIEGPSVVISTACSSGAKVFAAAARQIACGVIDAAVVGGVDTLCLTTLYGFSSLQLTSAAPCRPFDVHRNGLSIGEAAAFILLERADHSRGRGIYFTGYGESSDAHHMSSPHPEGLGATYAMSSALQRSGITVDDVDYINLHGTATRTNDEIEGLAVARLFPHRPCCNSTKGATGHTLGAAGAIEAVICALALQEGFTPGSPNTQSVDMTHNLNYALYPQPAALRRVMSNSFGFGGSNCTLIFER